MHIRLVHILLKCTMQYWSQQLSIFYIVTNMDISQLHKPLQGIESLQLHYLLYNVIVFCLTG